MLIHTEVEPRPLPAWLLNIYPHRHDYSDGHQPSQSDVYEPWICEALEGVDEHYQNTTVLALEWLSRGVGQRARRYSPGATVDVDVKLPAAPSAAICAGTTRRLAYRVFQP